MNFYYKFFFGLYPYVCIITLILGALFRYDNKSYTWTTSSSLLLESKWLRIGSILMHVGILFILAGHCVGLLTPHSVYSHFITAEKKQLVAVIAGGAAGVIGFAGLSILLMRRLFIPQIRATSSFGDIAILMALWTQMALGLLSIPFTLSHHDASTMLKLSGWAQGIVKLNTQAFELIKGVDWVFQLHIILGLTIFLVLPFTRLVHFLSLPIAFIFRPHQIVRGR